MVDFNELRRDGLSELAVVNHSSNQSAFGMLWTCIRDKQACLVQSEGLFARHDDNWLDDGRSC